MKKYCANCISFNVCKYAEKRAPDMCRDYLFRSNPIREIMKEHERQNEKWGEQNHPMLDVPFTHDGMRSQAGAYKKINDSGSNPSWFAILMEEIYETFAETGPEKQYKEIIQVAAVSAQIAKSLKRKMETGK
jgi:hypothetical protein